VWYNNTQKQLNREIRRHTDVVSLFPNCPAIVSLVDAVMAQADNR
jgi:transposase-like protein